MRNSQLDQVLHPYLLLVYELRTELQLSRATVIWEEGKWYLTIITVLPESYVKFVLVARRRLGCFPQNCSHCVLKLGSRNSAGFFLPGYSHKKTLMQANTALCTSSYHPCTGPLQHVHSTFDFAKYNCLTLTCRCFDDKLSQQSTGERKDFF